MAPRGVGIVLSTGRIKQSTPSYFLIVFRSCDFDK